MLPVIQRVLSLTEAENMTLDQLADVNEAMQVFADQNDLSVTNPDPPHDPGRSVIPQPRSKYQ